MAKVEVWRKNVVLTIEVTLGELPEKSYAQGTTLNDNSNETNLLDLGLTILSTNNDEGVIVTKKDQNSSLLVGDIIVEVNREKITTVESFVELIDKLKKTGRISLLLKVLRDNQSIWETIKFKN